nr:unnamed protein product [Digitaria exilis]
MDPAGFRPLPRIGRSSTMVGFIVPEAPSSNKMVTLCPSVMIKFKEGNIFSFGSWVGVADWDGILHWTLDEIAQPEPAASQAQLRHDLQRIADTEKHLARTVPGRQPRPSTLEPGYHPDSTLCGVTDLRRFSRSNANNHVEPCMNKATPQRTLADLVISDTPDGVVVHWPVMDLSTIFRDNDDSHMVSTISTEVPQNPFQTGRDLSPDATSMVLIDSYSDDAHDPKRELYARVGGSDQVNRRLAVEFEEEGGAFATPAANIVKAKHLLEGVEDHPKITTAKDLLEVAAIQTNKLDRLNGSHAEASYNLRGKLKQKDARNRLIKMRRKCDAKYDGIRAFSNDIRAYKYPAGFKESSVDKYDGNSDPNLWLRLPPNLVGSPPRASIESWHALKKEFVNNFQGSADRLGTKYNLATCKQKLDESLCDYNCRFWAKKSKCIQLKDEEIITTLQQGIHDRYEFRQFYLIDAWANVEDEEPERFGQRNHGGGNNADCKPHDGKQRQDSYSRNQGNSRKRQPEETVAALKKAPKKATAQQHKEEFEKLLHKHCPLHPDSKHKIYECYWLQSGLGAPPLEKKKKGDDGDGDDKEDKTDEGFPRVNNQVNIILGGNYGSDSRRTRKKTDPHADQVVGSPDHIHQGRPVAFLPQAWTVPLARTLIDGGSGLNVIFTKTFKMMAFDLETDLKPATMPSLVVQDLPNSWQFPHYVYLLLKMPGPNGSYECDNKAVNLAMKAAADAAQKEVLLSTLQDKLETKKAGKHVAPAYEVVAKEIDLHTSDPSKMATIGAGLDPKKEDALVNFLRANWRIFAWKPSDMPSVPKELIEHALNVGKNAKPHRQRLRRFAQDRKEAIKKELKKLLAA